MARRRLPRAPRRFSLASIERTISCRNVETVLAIGGTAVAV